MGGESASSAAAMSKANPGCAEKKLKMQGFRKAASTARCYQGID
jgi:hypothetical protein